MATIIELGQVRDDATPAELVDAIRALEDRKAQDSATQAELTARLAAARPDDTAGLVGYARRESPHRAARHVGLAAALTTELPHTLAAMKDGALSEWRATLIARETACLRPELRRAIDHRIAAPHEDGTRRLDGWGDRRLVAEVRTMVAEADLAAVVERRSRAEADRRVTMRPAPDTMAQLSAILPVAQGVAVWATLSRLADQARAAGDTRSRGQIMADTLVERITGQVRADAVPITVNLVVSDEALLEGGSTPAWVQGFGSISADAARGLTQRAIADAKAALRRLYAAPATGALVAMESVARAFPKGLALFLELRDRSCHTAWCDAPIRHHDHIVRHADGGPTSDVNGQGACERCNQNKEVDGWEARPLGPPGDLHTVETRLPTGHTITSSAPRAPRPSRHRSSLASELYYRPFTIELAA